MHQAILDWIAGLAIKDCVNRHLAPSIEQGKASGERAFSALRKTLDRYVRAGAAECTLRRSIASPMDLRLSLTGSVDRRFFRRASHHLQRLLERSSATLTLQVTALREVDAPHLARLLERLERYGERIRISISAPLRPLIRIDWSVFNAVLEPLPGPSEAPARAIAP